MLCTVVVQYLARVLVLWCGANLGRGRDNELGSVRMTNDAAALPRLDCPSESHRREGADQNRQFRVRDTPGSTGRAAGQKVGGRRGEVVIWDP